jgi:hypothetical protein
VAEDLPHVADAGAALEEVRGAGVPEGVGMETGEARLTGMRPQPADQGALPQPPPAPGGEEEGVLSRVLEQEGTSVLEVEVQGREGSSGEGDETVPSPLAVTDEERALLQVDVRDAEADTLATPEAGAVEEPIGNCFCAARAR